MSLEDLAMKHVLHRINHPKDKSESILSKMRRRYGRQASQDAIEKAKDTLKIMDPNYKDPDTINWYSPSVSNQSMIDMLSLLQTEKDKMIGIENFYTFYGRLGKL